MSSRPESIPPDAAIRYTFRAELAPDVALALDRAVTVAREADVEPVELPAAVEAAAADLDAVAAYLDEWSDNLGDGVDREHVRLAGAVLDAVPVIRREAASLRGQLATPPPAELPEPPECAPERDRPALREVFACQLRQVERETVERLADNVLELSREGGSAVRAEIAYASFPDDFRAVALDLRHAERFLRILGASEGDVLDRQESRLADLAAQLAEPVGEVAGQLEAAVGGAS